MKNWDIIYPGNNDQFSGTQSKTENIPRKTTVWQHYADVICSLSAAALLIQFNNLSGKNIIMSLSWQTHLCSETSTNLLTGGSKMFYVFIWFWLCFLVLFRHCCHSWPTWSISVFSWLCFLINIFSSSLPHHLLPYHFYTTVILIVAAISF